MDAASPWIIAATEENFDSLVERSQEVPVVVDFWAPWCQPCAQMAPYLERAVSEADGAFLLAKVNVDEQPGLAQAFRVQSIPHMYVLRQGQVVDQAPGMLSELQLRQWFEKLQPTPAQKAVAEGLKLVSTEPAEAEEKFREAIELDANFASARIELARLYLGQHRNSDAQAQIDKLEARGFLEPEADSVKAELDLRAAAADSGDLSECRAALEKDPENAELQLKLADALAVAHQYPEALDLCLQIISRNFGDIREKARVTAVNLFQVLGNDSELARTYRKKLATALY